jgi:hypothetical protein
MMTARQVVCENHAPAQPANPGILQNLESAAAPVSVPVRSKARSDPSTLPNPFPLNFWNLSILAVAALALAIPMLIYGPMLQGHDTFEHLNYSRHFSEQFWHGELYPRWLMGMNHGLGSPSLFVYPPLPSYVYTLLQPAGRLLHFDAFKMEEFIALFGSGVCAFLWLSTIVNRGAALVTAALYMLMPYHLAIDYYQRTALSECWALVWMPLILYFTAKIIKGEGRFSVVGLAVSVALLILSHLVSVAIFSLLPLLVCLALSPCRRKLRSLLLVAAGMALGSGLSAFYLVSAFANAKYFPVTKLPLWSNLEGHLLTAGELFHPVPDGFIRLVCRSLLEMAALCTVCSLAVLVRGRSGSKRNVVFWLLVFVAPALLMHSRSAPLWRKLPLLHAAIQYPWRLSILLCLAAAPIVAIFLADASRLSRLSRVRLLGLLLVLVTPWLISYSTIWSLYRTQTPLPKPLVNDDDGWFPAWAVSGLNEASALRASAGPQARFVTGDGAATVRLWQPRHIEIQTDSPTGGKLMVTQFYYPLWQAGLGSDGKVLSVEPALPQGLLNVQVPAGIQQIRLEIPVSSAEYLGRYLSGFCLLSIIVLMCIRIARPRVVPPVPLNAG